MYRSRRPQRLGGSLGERLGNSPDFIATSGDHARVKGKWQTWLDSGPQAGWRTVAKATRHHRLKLILLDFATGFVNGDVRYGCLLYST